MAKKIHKLNVDLKYDFELIGISSHENDYRLSWTLNNTFGFNFVKTDNLEILTKTDNEKQIFSKYTYVDDDTLNLYNLISNRCDDGFLIEEHKNIDYIIMIFGENDKFYINNFISKIKSANIVTIAFQIDINTLKNRSKSKLIF